MSQMATRKNKQSGGIVGVVDLIRTTKNPDGTVAYPSLIEYLNFLEMNYTDKYYEVGTKIHSAFYANVSLNDVKELLSGLEYVFKNLCMRLLRELQNVPFAKRDMSAINRVNDIFMKSLLNVNTYRSDVTKITEQINNLKSSLEQPIVDDVVMNQVFELLEKYIRGNSSSGMTGGVLTTGCTQLGNTGISSCSSNTLVSTITIAKAVDPDVVNKIINVLSSGASSIVSGFGSAASGIGSVISSIFGGSSKRRASKSRSIKRKKSSKRRRPVSTKRRK